MPTKAPPSYDSRLQMAEEAGVILYQLGASRVWLFGSLSRISAPDRMSDIDLATEGLEPSKLRQITIQLRARFRCKLDVVGLESVPPNLRRGILQSHRLLASSADLLDRQSRLGLSSPPQPLPTTPRMLGLHEQRLRKAVEILKTQGSRRVLDLGCGEGQLLEILAEDPSIERLLGVDMSFAALQTARQRLHLLPGSTLQDRIVLSHSLVTNPSPEFQGFDAISAIELIEHLDPPRLLAFERVVFQYVQPATIVISTPNVEYNILWKSAATPRHKEHRFEWTRAQFRSWAARLAQKFGYKLEILPVGPEHAILGAATQLAAFKG